MESLIIEATKYTPYINLNAANGTLEIRGLSYPENTFEFYQPLMKWLECYFNGFAQEKTTVNFEITYFNSSSSKLLFDFFDFLANAHHQGYQLEINWIFDPDNESAQEAGEDFVADFEKMPINLIAKAE